MVPAGNKAKRLSPVNHTTKTIHYHLHHHHNSTFSIFFFQSCLTIFVEIIALIQNQINNVPPELAITCLKLTTETLEQGVENVQS